MLEQDYEHLVVHYFDNLTIEEKAKYFDAETMAQLSTIYKKINDYRLSRSMAWFSTLKDDLLQLKQEIDKAIKLLPEK